MKKYIVTLLFTTLLTTTLTASAVFYSKFIKKDASYYGILEEYQFSKIAKQGDADTIFVGDSSLGNAINTEEFDAIAGTRSLNLALTGIYGYSGTYNMIKRALRTNPIRNIFIIQTLDIMKRAVDYRAFLLTTEDLYDNNIPFDLQINIAKSFWIELFDKKAALSAITPHFLKKKENQKHAIVNDYHPQDIPLPLRYPTDQFDDVTINPRINSDQTTFLNLIGELCRQQKITCVYSFGPILNKIYSNSSQMVKNSTAKIASAGIPLAQDTPYLLDFSELGDSTDHVIPSRKNNVTRYYADILKQYIVHPQNTAQ